jgi:selenocysteine lyase/cysteine desulfurase
MLKVFENTKIMLGELINADSSRISFVDNTTNGLNILAQGIKWNKGDRILLNDIEFPANVYPFLNLQKDEVDIDFVKSHNGVVSAEDIIENVKPGTKLISVSQVQFLTGYRIDLQKLGNFCRENEIIFGVDAIQGLGAVRLDVQRDNIDFISCGTQKWLMGLQGLAFIYLSKNLQETLVQSYVGWHSVKNAWNLLDYNLNLREGADAFQTGTLNTIGIYGLNASLKMFNEFGYDEIEETIISNSKYFIGELDKININPILSQCEEHNLAGIVSFNNENSQKIFEKLTEKNIKAAVREGVIRFAPHFYNTKDEIDVVIDELKKIQNALDK